MINFGIQNDLTNLLSLKSHSQMKYDNGKYFEKKKNYS